ncbi:hypothetical protein BG003_010010 [Podila horticola]|nr:hypothetical protein BG003_010010 [Podila horticola]
MTYNILFLGQTQSGKSTLIEFLRHYSDPSYNISKDNIGVGIFSLTKDVSTTTIHTDLPSYFVTDNAGEQVDYGKFIEGNQEDYEDELNERMKYHLERDELITPKTTFNLIDTTGVNDTSMFRENNMAIIFKALKSIESIHLTVVTVANSAFTEDLKLALETYLNLLPELKANIVFVHTKTDYAKLHPQEDPVFAHSLDTKIRSLNTLLTDINAPVPHLLVDNDIGSTRTIRNCITRNTLRELLVLAKLNQPVRVGADGQSREHMIADRSSWAPPCLRKIVLLGDRGAGKSTLASMLTQGNLTESTFALNTPADPAVASIHTGREWTAVNTFGLNDLEGRGVRGADRAIRTLKRVLLESRGGCQYLAFVVNAKGIFAHGDGDSDGVGHCNGDALALGADRVGDEEGNENQRLFKLFCKTFAGAEKRFVVVITHCEDGWLHRHARQVAKAFGTVPVVSFNFTYDPEDPNKNAEKRREELLRLEAQLARLSREVVVPWLAFERGGSEAVGSTSAGVGIGGKGVAGVIQGEVLDAEKEFEQALGKFLGVGGFIVAVLLNLAKFFCMY